MNDPKYAWLWDEPGPKMLKAALELHGTRETLGRANNPIIMGWAEECGFKSAYSGDDVPWCGLFMAVCAKRAGWEFNPKGNALWARNWASWGNGVAVPMLGDIGVKVRDGGGHVGQVIGVSKDGSQVFLLGGNQSDAVNIRHFPRKDFIAFRRAPWRTAQPANVRSIILSAAGGPIARQD